MAGKTKKTKRGKNKGGRPSKLKPEIIGKLEEAFAIDASVEEACFYADINPDTYYVWIKNNPKLSERFTALRNKPVLQARRTIVKNLSTNSYDAKWYLERKRKKEFAERHEISGEDGEPIKLDVSIQQAIDKAYTKDKS